MSEDEAFLAAIDAAPLEDFPKLIYADWLEEQGDPAAEGLRWIVATKRRPYRQRDKVPYRHRMFGWHFQSGVHVTGGFLLPEEFYVHAGGLACVRDGEHALIYTTAGDAYLSAARAFILARADGWRPDLHVTTQRRDL